MSTTMDTAMLNVKFPHILTIVVIKLHPHCDWLIMDKSVKRYYSYYKNRIFFIG